MKYYKIEELLEDYYLEIYNEYILEPKEEQSKYYCEFVTVDIRNKVMENKTNYFNSLEICPKDWVFSIYMFVNLNPNKEFYFCSLVNLYDYVSELIFDNEFKRLVKCMLYIKENIFPFVNKI